MVKHMKKKKHENMAAEAETPLSTIAEAPQPEPEKLGEHNPSGALAAEESAPVEPTPRETPAPEPVERMDLSAVVEPAAEEAFGLPGGEPPAPPANEQLAAPRKPINPWLPAAIMAAIALFLSVCLSLAILGAANGGLRYGARDGLMLLQSQVDGLSQRMQAHEKTVADLQSRLNQLQELDPRIGSLEQESAALNQDLETLSTELQKTSQDVQAVQSALETMSQSSRDFQTFLQGLSELLSGLQTTHEPTP